MTHLPHIDDRIDELYDEIRDLQQQRVDEVRAPFPPRTTPGPPACSSSLTTEEQLDVLRAAWVAAGRSVRPASGRRLQGMIHRRAQRLTA